MDNIKRVIAGCRIHRHSNKVEAHHVIFTTVYACVFSFLAIGVWHYCNYRYYTAYLQPKPALGEPSQTMSFLSFMNSRDKGSLAGDNLPCYYWDTRGMRNQPFSKMQT